MNKLKQHSLLLLIFILIVSTVACASEKEYSADTTLNADTTVQNSTSEALLPEILDKTYPDTDFNILTRTGDTVWETVDVYSEEITGDVIGDAVYNRNMIVEEQYGVKIVQIVKAYPETEVSNSVLSGDSLFDAVTIKMQQQATLSIEGYLACLDDIPYMNLSNPWWDFSLIEDISISTSHYMALGDINFMDNYATWIVAFNKKLAKDYINEDIYKVIRDGNWTLDKLEQYCSLVSTDLNGDGVMTHEDQWGLIDSKNVAIAFLLGSSQRLVNRNNDGTISCNLKSDKMIDSLGKVYEFFSKSEFQLLTENIKGASTWTAAANCFTDGRALFRVTTIIDIPNMRSMTDDFGILPIPKLSETQDRYYSPFQEWNATVYSIPINIGDPEKSGAVLEYMAYASVDTLTPAVIDNALLSRYARDSESAEMLETIIFVTGISDLGYIYDWGSISASLKKVLTNQTDIISSSVTALEKAMIKEMEKDYLKATAVD